MKVLIDPRIKYNYASYYLMGLRDVYGSENIRYEITPFLSLSYNNIIEFNAGMPLVLEKGNTRHKVFIDFEDKQTINKERYDWCDLYCKINAQKEDVKKLSKLFVIGPSFGIRIESKTACLSSFFCNYFKGRKRTNIPFKIMLRDYLYVYLRRQTLERYMCPTEVRPNYVFHASTLWYDKGTDGTTNKYRGNFLKSCKSEGLTIEGGLFYIKSPTVLKKFPEYIKYLDDYKDFLYKDRLNISHYIEKTKASVCVFNTPSVCECHGWKLAEYLCMGKAIVSVPLTREMPDEGLIHGKHIHYVNSQEELGIAIHEINNSIDYRKHLETNARKYFEDYLSPEAVIHRINERIFATL